MSDDPKFDRAALLRYVEGQQASQAAPSKPKKLTVKSLAAIAGGNAADAASTIYALRKGAMETNPVYGESPSAAKVIGIKAASALGEALLLKSLAKGHPDLANAMAKAIGAAMGGIAVYNLRQVRK